MGVIDALGEQVVEPLRLGYLRYEVLFLRIQECVASVGVPARPCSSALRHLRTAAGSPSSGVDDQINRNGSFTEFFAALEQDCRRVRLFFHSHHQQLWARLLDTVGQLRTAAADLQRRRHTDDMAPPMFLVHLRTTLDGLGEDTEALETFARHNVASVAHLALLADGHLVGGGSSQESETEQVYLKAAEALLVGSQRLDPVYLGLSDAYQLLGLAEGDAAAAAVAGRDGAAPRWVAPQRFTRITRKFWLRPRDVPRFKTHIVRHLPILVYGDRLHLTEVDQDSLPFLAPPPTRDSSEVSSVYLDSLPELSAYYARLRRVDGAASIRLRWYGTRDSCDPTQQLFVERKIHREPDSNELSVKERAGLAQRDVAAFFNGGGISSVGDADAAFLADVQHQVLEAEQAPLLRTMYGRTAFQLSTNNLIRVSLDTDLTIVREAGGDIPRRTGDWCRVDPGSEGAPPLAASDVVRFPYAVVEVKLQQKPPQWLKQLVKTGLLLPAPRFSKFLHGTGVLFQDHTETLPHWFLPDDDDPSYFTPANWHEMADTSDPWVHDAAEWLFPRGFEAPPGSAVAVEAARSAADGPPPREKTKMSSHFGFFRRHRDPPATRALDATGVGGSFNSWLPWKVYQSPAPPKGIDGQFHTLQMDSSSDDMCPREASRDEGALLERIVIHSKAESHRENELGPTGEGSVQGSPQTHHEAQRELHSSGTPSGSEHLGATGRSTPQDSAGDLESGRKEDDHMQDGYGKGVAPLDHQGLQHLNRTTSPLTSFVSGDGSQLPNNGSGGLDDQGNGDGPPLVSIRRAKALVRTRIEPKTFFANERTFLAWLNISVLVMFLALSLLSGSSIIPQAGSSSSQSSSSSSGSSSSGSCAPGNSRCFAAKLSGALIAPVALAFMAYALFMYKKRTIQILRRETVRYDDQRGPVVLVVVLLGVMIISYVLALVYYF